jgi:hypothetical protein
MRKRLQMCPNCICTVYPVFSLNRFSATCFVWCSPEGYLPETPAGQVDDDLLKELLSGTTGVEDVELSEDPVSHAMAPVVVYRFQHNQVGWICILYTL